MRTIKPVILSLFDNHPCLNSLLDNLNGETGKITLRQFPDGESYVKFESDIENKDVIILNSLDKPDNKILPLLFTAKTAKELGAKSIGLCAPYLSYMRQDKRFKPGEGITSSYFASILSEYFDWLVTVDPHLHRHHDLSEIYTISTKSLHAAPLISDWVVKNIDKPVLIGPDGESEQWVSEIANLNSMPYFILEKVRHGDYDVAVSKPEVEQYKDYRSVLIDDIISTGRTMIETIKHLKNMGMNPPVCIGVHAVFADNAYELLLKAGVSEVITCNTINHVSNTIDLSSVISKEVEHQLTKLK